jgi:transcriptional regulator with XRE-family HTH domain
MASERSQLIEKLKNWKYYEAYIRASINVNLPSQIRALRLKQEMTQKDLASEAQMKQPRISAMEKPGATRFNIETLVRLAVAFRVGLIVKFVPLSEMLAWENGFSQDSFNVVTFEEDSGILPAAEAASVNTNRFSPTGTWCSASTPGPLLALPEASREIAMTPPPPDAGSIATVQGLYFQ